MGPTEVHPIRATRVCSPRWNYSPRPSMALIQRRCGRASVISHEVRLSARPPTTRGENMCLRVPDHIDSAALFFGALEFEEPSRMSLEDLYLVEAEPNFEAVVADGSRGPVSAKMAEMMICMAVQADGGRSAWRLSFRGRETARSPTTNRRATDATVARTTVQARIDGSFMVSERWRSRIAASVAGSGRGPRVRGTRPPPS